MNQIQMTGMKGQNILVINNYKRILMNKEDKLKIAKYDLKVAKQTAGRKKMDPKKKREWKLKLKKAERDVKKFSK